MPPTIWTIGYEAATFATLLAALRQAGIRMVIDVRELPLSRRAGFSKRVLCASLADAHMGYTHLRGLGTPKEGRLAARRGDSATFWSIVEAHMRGMEAQADLRRAADIAAHQPSVLLCVEADPQKCHRRVVAEELATQFGFAVQHLRV